MAPWQTRLVARLPRRWDDANRVLYRAVLTGAGLLGLVLAVEATWGDYYRSVGAFDEGVLLTNAHLLLRGQVPYRDFYSNYPPGIFALLAALFAIAGPSVAVERVLALVLHLAVAGLAGRMAGRLLGQRVSFVVTGLVAVWLVLLRMVAFAWLAGLVLALLACESWAVAQARGRPVGYAIVGATLGLLSWFRHDLFVYFTLALCAFAGAWLAVRLSQGQRRALFAPGSPLHGAPITLGAAVLVAAVLWLPLFGLAGISRVAHDLFLDQIHYTMPARVLPLPALATLDAVEWSPVRLPAFLLEPLPSAVLLTLAGPVLALAALLWPRGAGLSDRRGMFWLAALTIAVVPQMLGRTDVWHATFAVTPALIASVLWLSGGPERRWRGSRAWPLALLGALVLYAPVRYQLGKVATYAPVAPRADQPRVSRTPFGRDRRRALAFISEHTEKDDPIYVGLGDHRWTLASPMDLYFLSDRVGATRYMQFDPNLTNREEVQRSMIAELEQKRPKAAVLQYGERWSEPNKSNEEGSGLLDEYLRSHYQAFGRSGSLRFLLRLPDDAVRPPAATPAPITP